MPRDKSMGSVLLWVIRAIGALLAIMVVIVAITMSLAIPINLNLLRGPITWAVSKAMDREVHIEGSLQVEPGLWPTVTIAGLRIANPSFWQTPDFARIQQLRLRLGIVPLLEGRLHMAEIAVKGAAVSLETNRRGDTNWPFPEGEGLLDRFALVGLDNVSLHRIAITYRDEDATRVYALQVEQIKGSAAPEKALRLTGYGTFQQQAYTFLLTGGPIADLSTARRSWPMKLTADSAGAHLQLTGSIAPATKSKITTLDWELSGKRIGDLAAWFDVLPASNLPYAAHGQLRLRDTSFRLDGLALQLGRTALSGELALTGIPTERHCLGNLHFTVIDREELGNMFQPEESAADTDENVIFNMGIVNNIPLLTKLVGFNNTEIVAVKSVAGLFKLLKLHQADINITADRIVLPPTDITDVKVTFAGQFRDAWRLHIPSLQASLGRNRVTGDYSARGKPDGELDLATTLTARQVDLGDLLHSFGIAEDAQTSLGQVIVTAASHGKSLRDILTQADFQVTVENGQWIPPDHQTLRGLPMRLNQARVSVSPGQPVTLQVEGRAADTPVLLDMQSHSVAKLINAGERLPFRLQAQAADAQLELIGGIGLPLNRALLGAEITLTGDHLANLNGLLGTELPRLGP